MTYEPRSLSDDMNKPPSGQFVGSFNSNPTIIFPPGYGPTPQGTCSTCRHWLAEGSLCRRFPPTPRQVAATPPVGRPTCAIFPETKADDTCGEYSPAGGLQIERRG